MRSLETRGLTAWVVLVRVAPPKGGIGTGNPLAVSPPFQTPPLQAAPMGIGTTVPNAAIPALARPPRGLFPLMVGVMAARVVAVAMAKAAEITGAALVGSTETLYK